MTDLIEGIGPVLGIAAFLGLTILAFLIFQQGREVRRLREWAGRAPERAAEATDATAAVAEARGEAAEEAKTAGERAERGEGGGGRAAEWWGGVRERAEPAWAELDRHSPVDPRYLLAVIAAVVIAAAVLTSGFGILGDDGKDGKRGKREAAGGRPDKVEVAVLNATQEQSASGAVIAGVPGLADTVAKEVVKPAGYAIGEKTNASSGFPETVVMFEPGDEEAARELASAVSGELGATGVEPIVPDVAALAQGAPLVVVVGQDDAETFGGTAG
jgi:hypothetical protein